MIGAIVVGLILGLILVIFLERKRRRDEFEKRQERYRRML